LGQVYQQQAAQQETETERSNPLTEDRLGVMEEAAPTSSQEREEEEEEQLEAAVNGLNMQEGEEREEEGEGEELGAEGQVNYIIAQMKQVPVSVLLITFPAGYPDRRHCRFCAFA
jgi:hypothetical protein